MMVATRGDDGWRHIRTRSVSARPIPSPKTIVLAIQARDPVLSRFGWNFFVRLRAANPSDQQQSRRFSNDGARRRITALGLLDPRTPIISGPTPRVRRERTFDNSTAPCGTRERSRLPATNKWRTDAHVAAIPDSRSIGDADAG